MAEEEASLREEKFSRMSRGWAIGSADFRARLIADLDGGVRGANRFEVLGADREAQREAREAWWEERLQAAADALGISLGELPTAKSAREKVQLAAALKASTSVSNRWLAQRLRMGVSGSVPQYVRRLRVSGGERQTTGSQSRIHT